MSRAVVTGAAGLLGSRVADQLQGRGFDVVRTDAVTRSGIVPADITESAGWEPLLDGADLVVHAAAIVGEQGDPALFRRVNAHGTHLLLKAAERAQVGRFLHVSSIVVHGTDFPDQVDEAAPVHPTGNPYTDTKIAAEHQALLTAATGRLPVTVVRPGDIYGPGSQQWTLRPVQLLRQHRFALLDGGRGLLSPVYIDDVVDGLLAAALNPAGIGQIFHIAGGIGVPTAEFFGHYAHILGVPLWSIPPSAASGLARPLGLLRRIGREPPFSGRTLEYLSHPGTYSIAKAAELLNWKPAVSLSDGMRRTETWLRDQNLLGEPPR